MSRQQMLKIAHKNSCNKLKKKVYISNTMLNLILVLQLNNFYDIIQAMRGFMKKIKFDEFKDAIINEFKKGEIVNGKYFSTERYLFLQNLLVKYGSIEQIYNIAKLNLAGIDVKALGQKIIDSKNNKYNLLFARDVAGADIDAHNKVVEWNNEMTSCAGNYHVDVFGSNRKRIDNIIQKHQEIDKKVEQSFKDVYTKTDSVDSLHQDDEIELI